MHFKYIFIIDTPTQHFRFYKMAIDRFADSKESVCNAEDHSSIPGLGRTPGEVIGYSFQCLGLPW